MQQRFIIEFVVDLPNPDVAKDVETRLAREHLARVCEVIQDVTGYEPLSSPGHRGISIGHEPVTWSASDRDWRSEDEEDEDEDDE